MTGAATGTLLILAAAVVALSVLHRRAQRADAEDRARLFDRVAPLLEEARLIRDGGYPVLTGRLGGHAVTLRAIVDAVTLRKLPVLWVEIVVHRALAIEGTVNVLLRPLGTEFFSPDSGFAHELPAPPDVPRPVRVACASADRAPSAQVVGEVLAPATALLADPATKELGVGRRGLRVVLRVAEGDQASYRSTRRAVFDHPRVDPDAVARAVAVLEEIGDRVPTPAPRRGVLS